MEFVQQWADSIAHQVKAALNVWIYYFLKTHPILSNLFNKITYWENGLKVPVKLQ